MASIPGSKHVERFSWLKWIVAFIVFFAGTQLSLLAKVMTGSALFYFPIAMVIILIYWWGPRVLIPFYLNAVAGCYFWGLGKVVLWPVYALPETIFAALSWFFFIRLIRGKPWLPNLSEVLLFLLLGILLPLIVYKFFLETMFVVTGALSPKYFWHLLISTSLGDFISAFGIATPILFFGTGYMQRNHLFEHQEKIPSWSPATELSTFGQRLEIFLLLSLVVIMNQFLQFHQYWFLYGVLSLFAAIRYGFGITLLFNTFTLLWTYMTGVAGNGEIAEKLISSQTTLNIQLGTGLMYVFSVITARLVTDMKIARHELNKVNADLTHTNDELDQFVYSASHDLSAPLKSISGLINLSRTTMDLRQRSHYLDLIERSVIKLEKFIREIQDYSKSTREEVVPERIDLKKIGEEVILDLREVEGYQEMEFDLSDLHPIIVETDKTRLKIILLNLCINTINYRRTLTEERPILELSSARSDHGVLINIRDNGEGIRKEFQSKIFKMFFRGSERSKGPGLGLYIAKEAAKRISADLFFTSEYGKGSIFTLRLVHKPGLPEEI
jgi:two-component system, sensor histidine kinase